MRWFVIFLGLAGIAIVGGATIYLLWDLDWRWRPQTITKHAAEIADALGGSGWVSPHLNGPKVYVIVYRDCAPCVTLEQTVFPKLQAADVDTRVIVVARPDLNGQALSSPAERATVAELWTNRAWRLFQQWSQAKPERWTAAGIAPADGDAARTAVVEVGRQLVDSLAPRLADNGVRFAYPTAIWWTKDGRMHACACTNPRTFGFVEHELGA